MGKVLFVDDDTNLLSGLRRQFRKRYDLDCAPSGEAGLQMLSSRDDYSVVVSDMRMPDMDGVAFLTKVAEKYPDPQRIMLTGNADQQTAIDAVNKGHIFAFLNKPCESDVLAKTIDNAMERYRLAHLERDLLERTLAGSVKVLLDVMRVLNPIAFGRTCALQEPAVAIARALGATHSWEIKIATLLSSIGWISVPDYILEAVVSQKELTAKEQAIIDRHPEAAYQLLKNVPRLEEIARIIRYQRKNFDGTGAPEDEDVAYEDIPLGSRILRVLNAVTPLNRPKRPTAAAIDGLPMDDGRFDPAVLVVAKDVLAQSEKADNSAHTVVLEIPIGRVLSGDVLEEDLRSPEGKLLLSAGSEVSPFHLEKLRMHPAFKRITTPITVSRANAID